MNKITHPSMGTVRETKPTRIPPQTYVVDDPTQKIVSDPMTERLAQFEAPPEPQMHAVESPAKKRISETLEKLIFIGRLSKEVEIGGAKFEISTLLNREHDQVVRRMYEFTNPGDLFFLRVLTLANAIKTIDGMSIDDIEIDGEFTSDFDKRVAIVDYLQLSVVEKLYDAYEQLLKEEKGASENSEEIKNS